MKINAKNLKPGDKVKQGKKTFTVRSATIIELPVARTVETAVLTLQEDGEDGEPSFHDVHVRASKKMEVIQNSLFASIKSLFSKKKAREKNSENIYNVGTHLPAPKVKDVNS
jgi:hypothetical protein